MMLPNGHRQGRIYLNRVLLMPHLAIGAILAGMLVLGGAVESQRSASPCTPAFFELKEPVEVRTGGWTISFRLLAVGCSEDLGRAWPPPLDKVEEAFTPELREPHPVQTLMLIREKSPDLRARLTRRLNEVLKGAHAYDVFLFGTQASEGI